MGLFQKKTNPEPPFVPDGPVNYPYGLCIRTEAGLFLMREKFRFRIPTERVLQSWRFDVINTIESAVKHIKIVDKVGFRDGTLIRNIADNKLYLISQNKKMHITDPDVFRKYGLKQENIILVSDEEVRLHNDGEVLK